MSLEEENKVEVPAWYWVISVVAILWNMMGLVSFYFHSFMSDEDMAKLPPGEQELYASYPLWTTIVFAIATLFGFMGSLGLVMRKKWSILAFAISLVAILIQMTHSLFFTNSVAYYGPTAYIMPLFVIVLGAFFLWFSKYANDQKWLS